MRALFYENERWAPVEGFEGYYEVSDHGRVRSLSRVTAHRYAPRRLPGVILKPKCKPYPMVSLWKGSKSFGIRVHVLVAKAFVYRSCSLLENVEINHINSDKRDNHYSNLEWTTASGNQQHSWDVGGRSHRRLLTTEQIIEIKKRIESSYYFGMYRDLAKQYGVTLELISSIKRNKAYRNV